MRDNDDGSRMKNNMELVQLINEVLDDSCEDLYYAVTYVADEYTDISADDLMDIYLDLLLANDYANSATVEHQYMYYDAAPTPPHDNYIHVTSGG